MLQVHPTKDSMISYSNTGVTVCLTSVSIFKKAINFRLFIFHINLISLACQVHITLLSSGEHEDICFLLLNL